MINMDSILAKAKDCMEESGKQQEVEEKVDRLVLQGTDCKKHGCVYSPEEAAEKFRQVLIKEIKSLGITDDGGGSFSGGSLGATAISALTKLDTSSATSIGDGKYTVEVYFTDDLSRDSLAEDEYDGIDNIAALLNNGYSAGHTIYGVWLGHNNDQIISSLVKRGGANFVESAIVNFMGNYATDYNVIKIEADAVYN